jgi:hypothetical protein
MLVEILIKIGTYLLCLLSGGLIGQSIGHLRLATFTPQETLDKMKMLAVSPVIAKIVSTHIGNALNGIVLLFFGILILLLIKYKFALSLRTFFVFLGFSVNFIFLAWWMDKIKF